MSRASVASCKKEKEYIRRAEKYEKALSWVEDSPQEGFEYFESEEYMNKHTNSKSMLVDKFKKLGFSKGIRVMKVYCRYMPRMIKSRNDAYVPLESYFEEIENTGELKSRAPELMELFPNEKIWEELKRYAWDKWKIKIGFTKIDNKMVFKGKTIIFPYALVCVQEMDRDKIEMAPDIPAGREVIRVYNTLGQGVNDIAGWLRENYNINCQSNHPIGGLVNLVPLAVKAGMGFAGNNGLLVTEEFGQRQRIAPIFMQDKIFEYTGGSKEVGKAFCKKCGLCTRSCPTGAVKNFDEDGSTRIDRLKCYEEFNKTMGCSVCIKVCPFSKGNVRSYNE